MFCNFDAADYRQVIERQMQLDKEHHTGSTWVLSTHDVSLHFPHPCNPDKADDKVVRHGDRYGLDPNPADTLQPFLRFYQKWTGSKGEAMQLDRERGERRARAASLMMMGLPGSCYLYQSVVFLSLNSDSSCCGIRHTRLIQAEARSSASRKYWTLQTTGSKIPGSSGPTVSTEAEMAAVYRCHGLICPMTTLASPKVAPRTLTSHSPRGGAITVWRSRSKKSTVRSTCTNPLSRSGGRCRRKKR